MNIALDVMGGDHAPEAVIDGMLLALETLGNEDRILAIGPAKKTEALLAERGYQADPQVPNGLRARPPPRPAETMRPGEPE